MVPVHILEYVCFTMKYCNQSIGHMRGPYFRSAWTLLVYRIGAIVSSKYMAVNSIRIALLIPAIMARYTFYTWQPAKGCWSI